ncbi:TPA: AlpA family phage regulatory protein [Klebsiella quasipneumoniae subsp. similipneumoniae]|uniref:AlpA family phage regulatory protein n=1 Tax=Klebsiella variicola TaxID=244366 RepID=UPI0024055F04|nr:AlpA family phage regulatory protein [Klebsiella variicola]HDH1374214.1 AlpA family phage regulatory protein [Klebsiella quasipneumoniae subsp. similipneumoniae]HDH1376594.1 AlpA family phage regulatory protein [Klebsiella quasipneumoniae subsp. similipneumoniae]
MSNVSEQKAHPLCILRMTELTAILGISRSSIYEKLNPKSRYYDAEFPKPVRLSVNGLVFLAMGSLHAFRPNENNRAFRWAYQWA